MSSECFRSPVAINRSLEGLEDDSIQITTELPTQSGVGSSRWSAFLVCRPRRLNRGFGVPTSPSGRTHFAWSVLGGSSCWATGATFHRSTLCFWAGLNLVKS